MPGNSPRRLSWMLSAALALAGCAPTLSYWSGEPTPDFGGIRSPGAGAIALEAVEPGPAPELEPAFTPLDPPRLREAMQAFRKELLAAGVPVADRPPMTHVIRAEAWVHAYRYVATMWESSYTTIGTVVSGEPWLLRVPEYNEYPVILEQRDIDWIVVVLSCAPALDCRDPSPQPVWKGYFTFKEADFWRREAAALRLIAERVGSSGADCPASIPAPVQQRCFWKDALSLKRQP